MYVGELLHPPFLSFSPLYRRAGIESVRWLAFRWLGGGVSPVLNPIVLRLLGGSQQEGVCKSALLFLGRVESRPPRIYFQFLG